MSNYQSNLPSSWSVRLCDGQHVEVKTQLATTNACGVLVLSNGADEVQRVFAPGQWQEIERITARAS